jgi:hypothetical protein
LSRRAIILIAVGATLVGLILGGLLAYPRIGAWAIRSKVVPKLAAKLGRDVVIGDIDVGYGHATLTDITVRGPHDGDQPLARVSRVDIDFGFWGSLVGSVDVEEVVVERVAIAVRRDAAGADNATDVLDRLRGKGASAPSDGGSASLRPARLTVQHVSIDAVDEGAGVFGKVGDGTIVANAGEPLDVRLRDLAATTSLGQSAGADAISARIDRGKAGRVVTIAGGRVSLWPKMALTGIGGTVGDGDASGRYVVDLAGGYGDVDGTLWTAKGWVEPATATASLALDADRFTLDKLAPILERSAVLDYDKTSVDASLRIEVKGAVATFAGGFHLRGLTVSHPMIAEKPVADLDVSGDIAGNFDRAARILTLDRGDFVSRGLPFSLTGHGALPGGLLADGTRRVARALDAKLVIPPVPCQQVLAAVPLEMAPFLSGFELTGTFDAELHVAIDWANLDATRFTDDKEEHVGIRNCKVKKAPADVGRRLAEPFEHAVEVDKDDWVSFVVGPENPDFVPLDQISPHLRNSIMSTEDSAFYFHHGFIVHEFKSALIKNLKAGAFRYGASSITMQLVKNVLLYREKTLARKFQELFLTWYLETILSKDRLYEIYLNVIEYGPGLYGIGPAARRYFGKPASEITPREAAFFSSILPAPKQRYIQYCQGTLQKWTDDKLDRILKIMLDRDRITQEEYDQAMATPLVFVKDGSETEEECLDRTRRAIRHARSTNPMRDKQP